MPSRDKRGRPRLLDLFCGAGGATAGYQRAGFYVVGVDIRPQPRYCGDAFVQADALEVLCEWHFKTFNAVHASPPCQDYSRALRHLSSPAPRLVEPVRELLLQTGLPWVIENVPGAPLPTQATLEGRYGAELCGTQFGLRIGRHRLFEASFPLSAPAAPCRCRGMHVLNPYHDEGRERIYAEFGRAGADKAEIVWRLEMDVPWMNRYEGREAIPPAFTGFVGEQLLAPPVEDKAAA